MRAPGGAVDMQKNWGNLCPYLNINKELLENELYAQSLRAMKTQCANFTVNLIYILDS
jgi:hypothetical protein